MIAVMTKDDDDEPPRVNFFSKSFSVVSHLKILSSLLLLLTPCC